MHCEAARKNSIKNSSELNDILFSAPANCLAENTEPGIHYVGNLEDDDKFVDVIALESCRGRCTTKGAKYFSWFDNDCYCKNAYTERRQEEHVISGSTNLSMCNGK